MQASTEPIEDWSFTTKQLAKIVKEGESLRDPTCLNGWKRQKVGTHYVFIAPVTNLRISNMTHLRKYAQSKGWIVATSEE